MEMEDKAYSLNSIKHPYNQSFLKTIWYYLSWPFVRPKVNHDGVEKVEFPFFRYPDKIKLKDAWIVYGNATYPKKQTEEEICRINNEFFRYPKTGDQNIAIGDHSGMVITSAINNIRIGCFKDEDKENG